MKEADSDSGVRSSLRVLGWCGRVAHRTQTNIKWSRVAESDLSLFAVK